MGRTQAQLLAAQIAAGFGVLQCQACAEKIKEALIDASCHGVWIELVAVGGREFMVCTAHDEGRTAISWNGRHVGVMVDGLVFDNLYHDGLAFETWLSSFAAIDGIAVKISQGF